MAIESSSSNTNPPITPVSFTTPPQVVAGNNEPTVFTPMQSHLTTEEIKSDGTSWVKILTITMLLLLVLDGAVWGFNIYRGEQNPDLLSPVLNLINLARP